MKILMVTAETVPFAKTGGLADMVSALAIQLSKMGHDVKIVMPRYYKIDRSKLTQLEGPMAIAAGQVETWSAVYETKMPGCDRFISLTTNSALDATAYMEFRLKQTSMITHIALRSSITVLSSYAAN